MPKRKRRRGSICGEFWTGASLEQETAQYKLGLARVPIDALACHEDNRTIETEQIEKLLKGFTKGGVEWASTRNYMVVECRKEAFEAMVEDLNAKRKIGIKPGAVLDFGQWESVNPGEKVVVIDGQHRLAACVEYNKGVESKGESGKVASWTCMFYNTLPDKIRGMLRMNREDLGMKDGEGEIWMQMVKQGLEGEVMGCDDTARGILVLREGLRLGNEVKFPEELMVRLVRKENWRVMISRWCSSVLGRRTFQIRRWTFLSSMQMNTYWFMLMGEVLATLEKLPEEAQNVMTEEDWARLSEASGGSGWEEGGQGDTEERRQRLGLLFHKGRDEVGSEKDERKDREIFPKLNEEALEKTWKAVQGEGWVLGFRTIGPLVQMKEDESRVVKQVMRHVASWFGEPVQGMGNSRKAEQPGLREGRMMGKMIALAVEGGMGDGDAARWAEDKTIWLERLVMEAVWGERKAIKDGEWMGYMEIYAEHDYGGYGVRFGKEGWWKRILEGVERIHGILGLGLFRAPWDRKAERAMEWWEGLAEEFVRAVAQQAQKSEKIQNDGRLRGEVAAKRLEEGTREMVLGWIGECFGRGEDVEGLVGLV